MMRKLTLLMFAFLAAGCTSLTVTKIDHDDMTTEGIRFSLPSRFVMVEPQPDGSMTVKVIHLPDENNTFAVTSRSVLAKNKLVVTVAEGLLKDITFEGDATAVPSQLATSAGNIRAKNIETSVAAGKTAQTKITELRQKLQAAEVEESQASKRYELTNDALGDKNEKTIEAKILWELAKIKTADLRLQLGTLTSTANDPALFNDPSSAPTSAFGPTLFRIVDVKSGGVHRVLLEQVTQQGEYKVRIAGRNAGAEGSVSCPSEDQLISSIIADLVNGQFTVTLTLTQAVTIEGFDLYKFVDPGNAINSGSAMEFTKGSHILTIPNGEANTEYQLVLRGVGGAADCELPLGFTTPTP